MSAEKDRSSSSKIIEENKNKIRSWSSLSFFLPKGRNPHYEKFLRSYFDGQLRIAEDRRVDAKEILDGLAKKTGFEEFEEKNQTILAAIDIVVTGSTNRKRGLREEIIGERTVLKRGVIKPAFKIIDV